ncbi:hypothetical protein DPMN_045049 [Dreissena polymorpha]|uniref:Uncharacterized protein n=1 Tax=Dreissena polymorpha TaxID=45954 RepID=A0A9D4I110_DREPO|nr:hypothetical protein DPMN_045049 [Dreissena polymorpha]
MSDKATQAFINQIREREGYAEEIVSDESVLSEAQDIFEAFVKVQMRKDARQAETSKAENIARRLIEVADEMECNLNQMFEKKNKAYSDLTSYEKFKKNAKPFIHPYQHVRRMRAFNLLGGRIDRKTGYKERRRLVTFVAVWY